jgi:hypothetical protein
MVQYLDAVIRNFQRTEGHIDCFNTMKSNCEELDCKWYDICQQKDQDFVPEETIGDKSLFDYEAA